MLGVFTDFVGVAGLPGVQVEDIQYSGQGQPRRALLGLGVFKSDWETKLRTGHCVLPHFMCTLHLCMELH